MLTIPCTSLFRISCIIPNYGLKIITKIILSDTLLHCMTTLLEYYNKTTSLTIY